MTAASRWQPDAATLAAGARIRVPYHGGPPADEGTEQRPIDPRVLAIRDAVQTRFPQVVTTYTYGRDYAGTEFVDIHRDGRAVDLMAPDYATGTAVASWLIQQAAADPVAFPVQYLIWWGTQWGTVAGDSTQTARTFKDYNGASNHHDHVHVEVARADSPLVVLSGGWTLPGVLAGLGLVGATWWFLTRKRTR